MTRLLILLPSALALLFSSPHSAPECETGCRTTIVVQDCSGQPVAAARLDIKVCCGDEGQRSAITDSNGAATFPYCDKDLCQMKVILQGFREQTANGNNCSHNGKDATCKISICSR